ncbi:MULTISPECIES: hypothetical protein [Bacillus]|uniref:hypothetical protein n=1 Tax=Bacillus TaxID=1386 RepID=UPI00397D8E53
MAGLAVGAMGLSIWTLVRQTGNLVKNKYFTIHWAANSNIADETLLFTCEKHTI